MNSCLSRNRDVLIVAGVALCARLAVVVWAAGRIHPTADGDFYHVIGSRIARGLGYTWLWPDGAVTYAGHYPVGYPGMLGVLYAVFGALPWIGMVANALLGTAGVIAAYLLATRSTSCRAALAVGLVVALHIALIPYTAALMTEGVAGSLWVLSVAAAMFAREMQGRRRWLAWGALGLLLGAATLVRPQTMLLIPFVALLSNERGVAWRRRLGAAAVVCILACLPLAPWIVRNHVRMGEAGLSFNGGWNLLIGANPQAKGTFAPLVVPYECRDVFDEAKKDICFRRAAAKRILDEPAAWIALIPAKLGATFNYCGAAGWYLHEANPAAFPYRAKVVLGTVETLFLRLVMLAALLAMALSGGARKKPRIVVAAVSGLSLFTPHAWLAVVGLLVVLLLFGRGLVRMPTAIPATAAALGVTMFSHALFFGAGRYALVVFPLVTVLVGGVRREDGPANMLEGI